MCFTIIVLTRRRPWRRPWALSDIVRQGKALYVGISNYQAEEAEAAIRILRENKTPCLLHQPRYNMFERWAEDGLLELLDREGVGCICYSPLAQGALTGRYLNGIPEGSRASKKGSTIGGRYLTEDKLVKIRLWTGLPESADSPWPDGPGLGASQEGSHQRPHRASSIAQLEDNVKALDNLAFSREELAEIEGILKG